jgi:hypothetical protein
VLRLTQWIAPILCAGKDSSRPSRRRVARDLVVSTFSTFGSSRGESFMLFCISKPRTPKMLKALKVGPADITKHPQPSIQRDTWRPIEPSRRFTHRDSEVQGAAPSYSRRARCRERPRPGPTVSPSEFRTVRSEKDAWRQNKPSRVSLIVISRSRDQPLPIHER